MSYGTKVLELVKCKIAVEVGTAKDLVTTLELIKTAVLKGELDRQIKAAANELRDGFAQSMQPIEKRRRSRLFSSSNG